MRKLTLFFLLLLSSLTTLYAQKNRPPSNSQTVNFKALEKSEKINPPKIEPRIAEEWEEDEEGERIRKPKKISRGNKALRRYFPSKVQNKANSLRMQSPIPSTSFNALDDNGTTIPPDVHGVAGPNHLMVVLNSQFRILDKSGIVVSTVSSAGFWAGVTPGGFADPHVLYDHYSDRWILVGQSDANNSAMLVAVSQTNDPTGTWNRYAFDVDPANQIWFDFPLVGFNQNWLVITGNMFNVSNNGWAQKSQIYIFDKSVLNSGSPVTLGTNAQLITSDPLAYAFAMSPATNYGTTNSMFLLETWDGSVGQLRLSRLRGTIPNVEWNVNAATFPANGSTNWNWSPNPSGDFAPQKGDTRKIAVNDDRLNNVVMRNGKLWAAHHVFLPGNSTTTRGAIQWWVIDTATDTPVQIGLIDDPTGKTTRTFPSVAVDAAENMAIGYSIFSADTYPSSAYSFRNACTPLNTMQTEVVYKNGLSPYFKRFGGSRCRWGDYSNTCLDPLTGRFWTIQEYAAQRTGGNDNDSRWGTWWAEINPETSNAVTFGNLLGKLGEETIQTTDCRGYKDYPVVVSAFCAATGSATLNFTSSGTAVPGKDYDLIPSSVSFSTGESSKTISLRVYNDEAVEPDELIVLGYTITGSGLVAGTAGQSQTIIISDNDKAPTTTATFNGTVGNGSADLTATSFLQSNYKRAKYQHLVLATELTAKGITAGIIQGLAFNIKQRGNVDPFTYKGFTISIAPTTASTVNPPVTGGFVQVYSGNYTVSTTGLQTFNFSTPFSWNGTSNLVVQVCFDNDEEPLGVGPDVLTGVSSVSGVTTPTVLARNSDVAPTTAGCNLAFTHTSNARPDLTFFGTVPGSVIASSLNTTFSTYLGPYADVYVYSASGEILARIKNNLNFDYGCTQLIVDRDGTSSAQFWNNSTPNYLASKTLRVIPTNNNPSGDYDITLYYTAAEVTGWQNATGQSWSNAKIVKVPTKVSDITPSSSASGIVVNAGSVASVFGNNYSITANFTTGFSGFGTGEPGGSVLPVTLVNFSGEKRNNDVELKWQTAFEYNNHHYEVEKSKDGIFFTKIGTIDSKGNSSTPLSYSYVDKHPARGTNYYRLQQVDINEKRSYSKTVAVVFADNGQTVVVYPNPATDKLTLSFASPQEGVRMNILSIDGRLVRTQELGAAERSKDISIVSLVKGSYILELQFGKEKQSIAFIKE